MSVREWETEVFQLITGYAFTVEGEYKATGSVTLISKGEMNILVDCGDPWNGKEIEAKLKKYGISPNEITHVVVTHGHVDHCGNLSMFAKAQVFMSLDYVGPDGNYNSFTRESGYDISPDVSISVLSGHTSCDLIVAVSNTRLGTVVISGDIFESENDAGIWQAASGYREEQIISRRRIMEMADYIIPGHGPIFKVDKNKL